MPSLEHTGVIEGETATALLLNPQTAYVVRVKCRHCEAQGYLAAAGIWIDDLDQATIYRSFDIGQEALRKARGEMTPGSCLMDGEFDVAPMDGLIK